MKLSDYIATLKSCLHKLADAETEQRRSFDDNTTLYEISKFNKSVCDFRESLNNCISTSEKLKTLDSRSFHTAGELAKEKGLFNSSVPQHYVSSAKFTHSESFPVVFVQILKSAGMMEVVTDAKNPLDDNDIRISLEYDKRNEPIELMCPIWDLWEEDDFPEEKKSFNLKAMSLSSGFLPPI